MTFSNTDKEITLIYSSKDPISAGKQILAYAQDVKIPIHDIDLEHVEVTPTQWSEIASRMGKDVQELVNTEGPYFLKKFGDIDISSEDDWLKILVNNPAVLTAPIVMKGDKVVAMKNPQDMLQFVE